jgi:hypothetical protein
VNPSWQFGNLDKFLEATFVIGYLCGGKKHLTLLTRRLGILSCHHRRRCLSSPFALRCHVTAAAVVRALQTSCVPSALIKIKVKRKDAYLTRSRFDSCGWAQSRSGHLVSRFRTRESEGARALQPAGSHAGFWAPQLRRVRRTRPTTGQGQVEAVRRREPFVRERRESRRFGASRDPREPWGSRMEVAT